MKNLCVCFTGHRVIPADRAPVIASRLYDTLKELIREGFFEFAAGGALGFDTLAAKVVLALKKEFPIIKLRLILPCVEQTKGWKSSDVTVYEAIRSEADEVIYTATEYSPGCMHARNRRLVDESSVCVCYLTNERGGTAYTVKYARENSLRIINLA